MNEFWILLCQIAPYLLLGFLCAGLINYFLKDNIIKKIMGKGKKFAVLNAAFFGVPLPLCSCGIAPVANSLKKNSASPGAVVSFLLSTPQTGVDSILATYSVLGLWFAIWRPIQSFCMGLLGGTLVNLFGEDFKEENSDHDCDDDDDDDCCCCCHKKKEISFGCSCHNDNNKKPNWFQSIMSYAFLETPMDMGLSLLIGLVLSAIISVYLPKDLVSNIGGGIITQMLLMVIIGIPIYVCSIGSIPIAFTLLAAGVEPGAVLVFMVTGPETNLVTMSALIKMLGVRNFTIYILTVIVGAILAGLLFNNVLTFTGANIMMHHTEEMGIFNAVCGVVLLWLLLLGIYNKYIRK